MSDLYADSNLDDDDAVETGAQGASGGAGYAGTHVPRMTYGDFMRHGVEQAAMRHGVPVNVLMALTEADTAKIAAPSAELDATNIGRTAAPLVNIDAAARRLRSDLTTGRRMEDLVEPAILDRAVKIYDSLYAPPKPQPPAPQPKAETKDPTTWQNVTDIGHGLAVGVNTLGQHVRGLASHVLPQAAIEALDSADAAIFGAPFEERKKESIAYHRGAQTQKMQGASQKLWWDSEKGQLGPAWTDWRSYASGIVESAPETVVTMLPGLGLARGVYAAKVASGVAPELAAKAAAKVATFAGAATEGLFGGEQSYQEVREAIDKIPDDVMARSEGFQAFKSQGLSDADARKALSDTLSTRAGITGGIATGIFGGMGDRVIAKILVEKSGSGLIRRMLGDIVKGGVGEGGEELGQSAFQQLAQNAALQKADDRVNLSDDVMNQALGGMAIGAAQGGGMGAAASAVSGRSPAPAQPSPAGGGEGAVPPDGGTVQPAPPDAAALAPPVRPTVPQVAAAAPEPSGPLGRAMSAAPAVAGEPASARAPDAPVIASIEGLDPIRATVESQSATGLRIRDETGARYDISAEDLASGLVRLAPADGARQAAPLTSVPRIAAPADGPALPAAPDASTPAGADSGLEPSAPAQGPWGGASVASVPQSGNPAAAAAPAPPAPPASPAAGDAPAVRALTTASGKPFPSKGAAKQGLRKRGLDPEAYDLHPEGQGFVAVPKSEAAMTNDAGSELAGTARITAPEPAGAPKVRRSEGVLTASAGKPFPSLGAAKQGLRRRGLDVEAYDLRPVEGGFVAAPRAASPAPEPVGSGADQAAQPPAAGAQPRPAPKAPPLDLSDWSKGRLLTRHAYLERQAKTNGWSARLVEERQRVEEALTHLQGEKNGSGGAVDGSAGAPAAAGPGGVAAAGSSGDLGAAPEGGGKRARVAAPGVPEGVVRTDRVTQPEPALTTDRAAHAAATSPLNDRPEPTPAQKEAGNYKHGHLRLGGLDISIEHPRGSARSGTDAAGKPWSQVMKSHYGYIRGTVGRDKDHVDVFVRAGTEYLAEDAPVFVVDQVDPKTGAFDEHKVMLGYESPGQAKQAYRANYAPKWGGLGGVTRMTLAEFKVWVADPRNMGRPAAGEAPSAQEGEGGRAQGEMKFSLADKGRDLAEARRFLEGAPVASMTGDEVPRMGKAVNIIDWAASHFDHTIHGQIQHPEIGLVRLDRRSAKDTLIHGYGKDKVQALYLLPDALPKSMVLAKNVRGRDQTGYILASPVEIGGKRYVLASVIKQTPERTGLYVHEAILLERLQDAFKTAATSDAAASADQTRSNPGAIRKILSDVFSVNERDTQAEIKFSIADKSPEDFVPAPDGHIDLGRITEDQFGGVEAPIRLRVGDERSGLVHIERDGRLQQIVAAGYADGREMVADVAAHYDSIYRGHGRALLLVKRDRKPNSVIVVKLVPDARGNFYDVETAIVARSDYFKNKTPIWEEPQGRAQSNQSVSGPPGAVSGSGSIQSIADPDNSSKNGFKSATDLEARLRDGLHGKALTPLLESGHVVLHDGEDTLPPHPPQSAPIQGMTDKDGTIHLVAENLTEASAVPVLLHEAFQARGEGLLGQKQWRALLARLERFLTRQSAKPEAERSPFWRDAIRRMEGAGTPAHLRAEEMAAYAIEHRAKAPAGVQVVVDNLIGHVKAWLLRRFGTQFGAVTPGQLRALAIAALRDGHSGVASADRFSLAGAAISRLVDLARKSGHNHETVEIAPAQAWLSSLAEENGLSISGMIHTIDTSAVRHVLDHHGDAGKEAPRGQVAISIDDIKALPRALEEAQRVVFNLKNARGQNQIAYVWETPSGSTLIVEEVRVGRRRLALASMRKYPGTINATRLTAILDPHVRNASQGNIKIVDVEGRGKGGGARFSLADRAAPATPAEQDSWLSKRLSDTLTRAMPALLRTVPLRPMLEELGKPLPAAQDYLKTKQQMDALRDAWHDKAAQVSQRWQKYIAKNGAENERLMAIMHEATLEQVDPSESFTPRFGTKEATALRYGTDSEAAEAARKVHEEDKARKAAWQALKQRYDALSGEAKDLFRTVRDTYSDQADAFENAILGNLEKAIQIAERRAQRTHAREMRRIADRGLTGKEKEAAVKAADAALKTVQTKMRWNLKYRISQLREQFESNRLAGPYFPLARFGDYFVTVRDKKTGEVASFSRFETPRKQRLFAEEMRRDPNVEVEVGVLGKNDGARAAVDPRFVADVEEMLAGAAVPEELRDDIWQRYLDTLPDFSQRKNRIHRLGRAGFQEDALRAYASSLFHGAHQLARLTHGMDLDEHINEAEEQAREAPDPVRAGLVVEEMKARNAYLKNPQGAAWAQHVSTAAFVYHLGLTPAAALVNLSQTVVIGIPVLGAYAGGTKGMAKANAELLRATRDFTRGKGYAENSSRLAPDEKAAMVAGYAMSIIQRTQSHDLAGVGEVGVAFSGRREQVMKVLSWGFHQAERFNREVTFLAGYRLARVKGESHADAIQTAASLTYKTHYDYQNTSRPGFMQDDKMRIAFTFRNYTINTLFRLFRDTHQALYGADAATRREARTQLYGITAMMALNAGIRGTWLFGAAMTLAGIFFGFGGKGEDDPEEELQKAVVSLLGPTLGGIALNGIPGHLLGISLSERIGMPDLWFRSPERQLEGKDEYYYWMSQMLGAAFAIPENAFRGLELISDGHVYRGVEAVMPKALRDVMKSYRWMTEGANTLKGDPILENVSPADLIKQAIGFTPAQIAERYQINTWMRNRADKIQSERTGILNDYARAVRNDDRAGMERAEKSIGPYNERHAYYPLFAKDLLKHLKRSQNASERTEDGLMLPPSLNEHVRGNSAPPIYR